MSDAKELRVALLAVMLILMFAILGCELETNPVNSDPVVNEAGFPVTMISAPEFAPFQPIQDNFIPMPGGDDPDETIEGNSIEEAFYVATDLALETTESEYIPYADQAYTIWNDPGSAVDLVLSNFRYDGMPNVLVGPTSAADVAAIETSDVSEDLLMLSHYPAAIGDREDDNLLCFATTPEHEMNVLFYQAIYSGFDSPTFDQSATIDFIIPSDFQDSTKYVDVISKYEWPKWSPLYINDIFYCHNGNIHGVLQEINDSWEGYYLFGQYYICFIGHDWHHDDIIEAIGSLNEYENYVDEADILVTSSFAGNEDIFNSRRAMESLENHNIFSVRPLVDPYGSTGEYYNRLEAMIHRPAVYESHLVHDIHKLLTATLTSFNLEELEGMDVATLKQRIIETSYDVYGITGPMSLDEYGDRNHISYEVMSIRSGRWQVIRESYGEIID